MPETAQVVPGVPVGCLVCRRLQFLTRGCCARCRARQAKVIRAGRITEAALVAAGALLPDARPEMRRRIGDELFKFVNAKRET